MKYKIGIDLGSTSLGWAVVKLDDNNNPSDLLDMGVRIFPDGRDVKSHEPLCVGRRIARGSRNRHDRILIRKKKVLDLINNNSMSFSDIEERQNPYVLRAKALYDKLTLPEFGRVLFHLSLRRGFKSNRKELKKTDGGKLAVASKKLETEIYDSGCKTIGEWLSKRYLEEKEKGVFAKSIRFNEKDNKDINVLYPTRQMYIDEFNMIWDKQQSFYPNLTDDLKHKFYNAIFYQRPLKEQEVGFCMFENGERRAYKRNPLFQKFRVLQTINQLEINSNSDIISLTLEQKNKIKDILLTSFIGVNKKGEITFAELKKQLGLKKNVKFNLESEKRKSIYADTTAFVLSNDNCFGNKWFEFSINEQNLILDKLSDDKIEDDDLLIELINFYSLSEEKANNILQAQIDEGTASLSQKAIENIIPYLEDGFLYHDACKKAGYHHSDVDSNIEGLDYLPYYASLDLIRKSCIGGNSDQNEQNLEKRYGKITNVSVHIALNQLRLIVNSLISKYGKPDAVSIELARELKVGTKGLSDINSEQTKNKKDNDRIKNELITNGLFNNDINISKEDIQKYKLWERLPLKDNKRICIYTGGQISVNDLYSPNVQIEHILPFSRTLDDSMANKIVAFSEGNYFKGNKTPYEAFASSNDPRFIWEDIYDRAQVLPDNVKWRFEKNAMDKFNDENNCIARQLNDTKYMSKLAVNYLKYICNNKNAVIGLPGQMTALFREQWGLNVFKNKDNEEMYRVSHLHHAIDAFVVACLKLSDLELIAKNADDIERLGNGKYPEMKEFRKALFKDNNEPFLNFNRADFKNKLESMAISYRTRNKKFDNTSHTTVGGLHEDTAYSLFSFDKGLKAWFVVKESIDSLKTVKDLKRVVDTYADKVLNTIGENDKALSEFIYHCEKNNKQKIKVKKLVDISTYVPVFRTKEDKENYRLAYINWYIEEGKSEHISDRGKIKEQKLKEDNLLYILREAAKKAYKWYVAGNIYKSEIYQISPNDKVYVKDAGSWQIEVMSNYMATINNGKSLWRLKYPTARKVMTLKTNDQIMLEFNGQKQIYNLKSIGQNKQFKLRHNKDTKDLDDKSRTFEPYLNELKEKKMRKVYISPIGELIDPGFDNKWSSENDKQHT